MFGLFLIKETPELQLYCEFYENFKNIYFVEYLQVTVSVKHWLKDSIFRKIWNFRTKTIEGCHCTFSSIYLEKLLIGCRVTSFSRPNSDKS